MPAMVSEQLANELMEGGARDYSGAEPLVNPSFVTSAAVGYGGPFFPNDALALLGEGFFAGVRTTSYYYYVPG